MGRALPTRLPGTPEQPTTPWLEHSTVVRPRRFDQPPGPHALRTSSEAGRRYGSDTIVTKAHHYVTLRRRASAAYARSGASAPPRPWELVSAKEGAATA